MGVWDIVGKYAISTHTPLARRDDRDLKQNFILPISTHTPLARRDHLQIAQEASTEYFYSHASRKA